jgi:hypothetical protein
MRPEILKKLFWSFLTISTLALINLGAVDLGLRNLVTPNGIISFELCTYNASCDAALTAWGDKGQALAMLSLGLDYLYLCTYPGYMCTGLLLVAPHVPAALKKITVAAAWLSLLACVADAIEN